MPAWQNKEILGLFGRKAKSKRSVEVVIIAYQHAPEFAMIQLYYDSIIILNENRKYIITTSTTPPTPSCRTFRPTTLSYPSCNLSATYPEITFILLYHR